MFRYSNRSTKHLQTNLFCEMENKEFISLKPKPRHYYYSIDSVQTVFLESELKVYKTTERTSL